MAALRSLDGTDLNSPATIERSYDIQAGIYTEHWKSGRDAAYKEALTADLAPLLEGAGTVLDIGVGEATSLIPLMDAVGWPDVFALDISVSRLLWAQDNIRRHGRQATLFCADAAHIPLPDGAVDVTVSVHSLEPNRGREDAILTELLRVTSSRLILVEPSDVFGDQAQAERMRTHGYVTNLPGRLEQLGATVIDHLPLTLDSEPSNRAGITIALVDGPTNVPTLVDPTSHTPLRDHGHALYSERDGLYYPVVLGIPVLRPDRAVLVSQYLAFGGGPWT